MPVHAVVAGMCACLMLLLPGCDDAQTKTAADKRPRPVTYLTLQSRDPVRSDRVAGSVASWKTKELGFEVAGRIRYVIEPERNIEGLRYDADGAVLSEGTLLAHIDDERYRLNVASVEAEMNTVRRQKEAAEVEIEKVIPAQRRAAEAQVDLADSEYERISALFGRSAASQSQLDKARADLDQAQASTAEIDAGIEAKRAEIASFDAKIEQLEQSRREAVRDLADCRLYSAYRGQVAAVHVVPGTFVSAGEPVVTVQMMDPISVELEVSPATLRRLSLRDMVPIHIVQPDESLRELLATVYMTDPVADPQTRTFTVTLLVRNELVHTPVPQDMQGQPVVRTSEVWRLISDTRDGEEFRMLDENSIQQDDRGHYVWKITNRQISPQTGMDHPKLNVTKIRVTPGQRREPFLGIWTFRDVTINDGEPFDMQTDLVAGALTFPRGMDPQSWNGDAVLFDPARWLLRPGDLVSVDLSGQAIQPGFYVPVDAIQSAAGTSAVYAVEASEGVDRARRIEVDVFDSVGTLRRIEAKGSPPLDPGMRVIASGALFVTDAEVVQPLEEVEVAR